MQMRIKKIISGLFILVSLFSLESCTSVKAYQRAYLNDAEMVLAKRRAQYFELNFLLYREGAAGANGAKTRGGCGCN